MHLTCHWCTKVGIVLQLMPGLAWAFAGQGKGDVPCPAQQMKNVDREYMWRCATVFDQSTGKFETDERCLDILGQKLYWGFKGGDECDQYWGNEDPGLISRLAPNEYDAYTDCMQEEMSKVTPAMMSNRQARVDTVLSNEKKCAKDLCRFHTGLFGYCSTFYETTIKNCPKMGNHREQFCTKVCPPHGGMLQDDPIANL